MKNIISCLSILFCISCDNENIKQFDEKQKNIKKGMSINNVNEIIGEPQYIDNRDSLLIAKYYYGNSDGYRYTIGFSKDSIVLWNEYEN